MILSTLLSEAISALIKGTSLQLKLEKSPLQDLHRKIFLKDHTQIPSPFNSPTQQFHLRESLGAHIIRDP